MIFQMLPGQLYFWEGETDELYWNDLVKTFEISIPFDMQWIGQKVSKDKCINTGSTALDKSENVLSLLPIKNMLLYDCDIKKINHSNRNVIIYGLPKFSNSNHINIGIENALVLDGINLSEFIEQRNMLMILAQSIQTMSWDKANLCEFIRALPQEQKKSIYANLRNELAKIVEVFNAKDEK